MYLDILRHRKKSGIDLEAYRADAAHMEAMVRRQPGFLTFRRYVDEDGEAISISEWKSEDDARSWANQPEHRAVQVRAQADYYENYVVYSCADPEVRSFTA
ncbi:antibiotic biosynthesis monooxygenase [Sphingobium sp.]|uniref:antibiotic biosynthesis monooxygenase family protein n=1 Tax=Sphingobium sp. TaxID=1912891 RepID=UPI002BB67238|nr:antibiotic biosynthesis monooxygenase [Sphingobium sp.]HUD93479.1 antibiotic biosynthesis monooxygenase [Sphingobium sp.]